MLLTTDHASSDQRHVFHTRRAITGSGGGRSDQLVFGLPDGACGVVPVLLCAPMHWVALIATNSKRCVTAP
jgi:hypothetical protein